MSFGLLLCLGISVLGPFFYVVLLRGKPPYLSKAFLTLGLGTGILAGVSLLLSKTYFFPKALELPSKETLTVTVFISFVEAGLLEELFKGAGYLLALRVARGYFAPLSPLQIMLLGSLIGLGFGFLENVYYCFQPEVGTPTIIMSRNFTSLLGHGVMNSVFGFLIARNHRPWNALLIAVLLHGIYDFLAIPPTLLGGILVKLWLLVGLGSCFWMGKVLWEESQPKNNQY